MYFTIEPADFSSEETETLTTAYTGKVQKLSPAVKYNGKTLKKGTDYTVSYPGEGYKEPGIYEITVTGKGNYSGTVKQTFLIETKDIGETELVYVNNVSTGTKKGSYKTTVVMKDEDGGTLKAGTDYTLKFYDDTDTEIPVSAKANDYFGKTLTAEILGKGSYTGSIRRTYTVVNGNENLSKAVITINAQKYLSGKPVEITSQDQISKAVMGKTPLTLGEDFEVYRYSNNTDKGTATVIFKGIGSCSGYKTVTFKIGQRSIKEYWGGVVSSLERLLNRLSH